MANEKTSKAGNKSSPSQGKTPKAEKKSKKSNEITEREKVHDPGYVHRIEEKTEKH